MNDLEITNLCAEKMGYKLGPHNFTAYLPIGPGRASLSFYRPLTDDAQAMKLMVTFLVSIGVVFADDPPGWCALVVNDYGKYESKNQPDPRRAICIAVAQMRAAEKIHPLNVKK